MASFRIGSKTGRCGTIDDEMNEEKENRFVGDGSLRVSLEAKRKKKKKKKAESGSPSTNTWQSHSPLMIGAPETSTLELVSAERSSLSRGSLLMTSEMEEKKKVRERKRT